MQDRLFHISPGPGISVGEFIETPIRDLMNPGVVAISADASLRAAYRAMAYRRVHAVLVIAPDGRPLGWVTARGLLSHVERDTSLTDIRDAISEEALTIVSSASVAEAIELMQASDSSHLIVVRQPGSFPVGTISDLDIAAFVGTL